MNEQLVVTIGLTYTLGLIGLGLCGLFHDEICNWISRRRMLATVPISCSDRIAGSRHSNAIGFVYTAKHLGGLGGQWPRHHQ